MFVVYCLLFVDCCLSWFFFGIWSLLLFVVAMCVVSRLLLFACSVIVCCLFWRGMLFVVCCLFVVLCCLMFVVCCSVFGVRCFVFDDCRSVVGVLVFRA